MIFPLLVLALAALELEEISFPEESPNTIRELRLDRLNISETAADIISMNKKGLENLADALLVRETLIDDERFLLRDFRQK